VKRVLRIVFNAGHALKEGKVAMYITERAVFKLTPTGVELVEVAPGVDVEKDVVKKRSLCLRLGNWRRWTRGSSARGSWASAERPSAY